MDRQKLGAIVFADTKRLARLNAIVHPPVLAEQDRELAAIEKADPHAIAVVEAALLIEAGFDKKLECLVVTWCTPGATACAADRFGQGPRADRRASPPAHRAQMPVEEKRRRADEVIDCSGTLEHTRAQVIALFAKLKGMEGEKFRDSRAGN